MQSVRSSPSRILPTSKKSSTTSKLSKPFQTETQRNRSTGSITNQVTVKKPTRKSSTSLKPVKKISVSDSTVPKTLNPVKKISVPDSTVAKRESEYVNKKNNNPITRSLKRENSDFISSPYYYNYYHDTATFSRSKKKAELVNNEEEGTIGECPGPTLKRNGTFPSFIKHGIKYRNYANNDRVPKQNKQRPTTRSRSRVSFDDDIDGNDDADLKQERDTQRILKKMKSLAMIVADEARTDIASLKATASDVDACAERLAESHRLDRNSIQLTEHRKSMTVSTDTELLRSGSFPILGHRRFQNFPPFSHPHLATAHQDPREPFYSETDTLLGEDLGVFSNTGLGNFITDMLSGDFVEPREVIDDCGEGTTSFIVAAYRILISLFDYIFQLFGFEKHLEPQEDFVRYNGYKIKVYGKVLLMESVHVNRDYQIDGKSWCSCRSHHSLFPFQPHTLSRECLRQESRMGDGFQEGRIRIVVRITGPAGAELEETGSVSGHYIRCASGKWTFFLNQNFEEGGTVKEKADNENFVEIVCPTGVHPETIEYAMKNGLLYIDAP